MDFLDPTVQDALSNITVVALLGTFIIFGVLALINKWVVIGWTYREKEKQVERLESKLDTMEALAWRGTHLSHIGTETAEKFAHRERNNHGPHE